ncbi:hypothetical protein V6N11_036226 [Hibiscus sabdariffa]|uniref:Uncharacterized protein n=1 Tax=Hibiscus sabdariffa TaxID=183260 RepID=A0ABR2RAH3_9ROSI
MTSEKEKARILSIAKVEGSYELPVAFTQELASSSLTCFDIEGNDAEHVKTPPLDRSKNEHLSLLKLVEATKPTMTFVKPKICDTKS